MLSSRLEIFYFHNHVHNEVSPELFSIQLQRTFENACIEVSVLYECTVVVVIIVIVIIIIVIIIIVIVMTRKLRRILDFEGSKNQRQGAEHFSREVDFTRWFPVASPTKDVFMMTHKRDRTDNACVTSLHA